MKGHNKFRNIIQHSAVSSFGFIFVLLHSLSQQCSPLYNYPMNFALFIARRLSLAAGGRRSSPAVRVATVAVALSVAVMMASIAVVQGFKKEITDRVTGFNSHISVYAERLSDRDDNIITLTPTLRSLLDTQPDIAGYSLQAMAPAVLKTADDFKGVYLKSLADSAMSAFIGTHIDEGSLPDFTDPENADKTVISRIAARQLGLAVGDRIDTYFITDEVRVRRLEVAAIFNTHFDSYDNVLIYGALSLLQQIGGLDSTQGTSLQVTLHDFRNAGSATVSLRDSLLHAFADGRLYRHYYVDNALNQGAGYFRWLSLLDTNVIVIIVLMTVVACVTLVSGMLIIILDKKRFIGLMKALGCPDSKLRAVFIYLTLRVSLTGMAVGTLLMSVLLWIQHSAHIIPLDPESYYIDYVPVSIHWPEIVVLNLAAFIIAALVLLVPSSFVARISPTETMSR